MPHAGLPVSPQELVRFAARADVVARMRAFYLRADSLIAAQPGTCWNKGACCHFGAYGHRLYVTTLEVCHYLATGTAAPPLSADTCPHAYDGKCHVRDRRPLGCRIFYCDPLAQAWQGPITEELLGELRALHSELDVPYFYADWMVVLGALETAGLAGAGDTATTTAPPMVTLPWPKAGPRPPAPGDA